VKAKRGLSRFFLLSVIGCIGILFLSNCAKKNAQPKPPSFEDKVDEVASKILQIAGNSQEFGFHNKHFDNLIDAVAALVKSKPDYYLNFLQAMIDIASRTSPTLGLQVENYASDVIRAEMAKLRQDANVAELERLRQEINDYRGKLNIAEQELKKKVEEIQGLKAKVEPPADGVPVVFSTGRSGSVGFKFINVGTNRFWVGIIPVGSWSAEIKLPPGKYRVEGSQDGRQLGEPKDLTVTPEPSINHEGKWYHGYVWH